MEHEKTPVNTPDDSAKVLYLTRENAEFYIENNFVCLRLSCEEHGRIFLHRDFPFELPWEYISVLDGDKREIGIIRSLDDFDEETKEILREELLRRYYSPKIVEIHSVKERFGFSYWKVRTEDGPISFTLRDTYRSIIRVGDDRAILLDVDGNRFEIPSIEALDRKSYKRIELYL